MKKYNKYSFKVILLFFTVYFIFVFNSTAQFFDEITNPTVDVFLIHPPSLGIIINKVIFNPATSNCSDQIIDALISDFVSNDVEVIERNNLQAILAEHNFSFSGYVDKSTSVSIGKIIGPSAMITVKVLRCQTEIKDNLYADEKQYDPKTKTSYFVKAYISRTTFYLKASIQTTDLTTGRIFTARVLEYSPSVENKSYTGRPEAPDKYKIQEKAYKDLASDVHKMFFPWAEKSNIYFMNDKTGGLKGTYEVLKSGDINRAFELSKENLEYCKNTSGINDKILAHAYYNVGTMYFIQAEYDNAIEFFQESQKIRPGSITTNSISKCLKAKSLLEEMQRIDDKMTIEIEKNISETQQAEQEQIANTLTNTDIISLIEKKLSTNLVIQKIKTSTCSFDTSADELVKLTNAGVPEEIILLMMEKE